MEPRNRTNTPDITIQIVHLDGSRQGQIDEFQRPRVSIGRDQACDVKIDTEARSVSRKHAEIIRDGSRFLFINHGKNGSLVNGLLVDQTALKQGDIIVLGGNGPRISFLTQHQFAPSTSEPHANFLRRLPDNDPAVSRRQLPEETAFTVQYGTYVRTVHKPICRFGRDVKADFVISHPSVHAFHAEVVYKGGEYFIHDITGTPSTHVNQHDARHEVAIAVSDIIELGKRGPQFRFLGEGRFIEHNEAATPPKTATEYPLAFDCHRAFANTDSNCDQPRGFTAWFRRKIKF